MFERRRINILANDIFLLGQEHLKLIKEGKHAKAAKISFKIDELSNKMQQLTEKELYKTVLKADKASEKLDREMKKFDNFFDNVSEEESEAMLNSIMRSR